MSEFTVIGLADMLLNFTAVVPVNPEPVIVTAVPAAPEIGENVVTAGVPSTVKRPVLEPVPADVVTLTNDVEAPEGTAVLIWVSETTVKLEATTDPKATEVAPVNPEPLMVTAVPTPPLVGEKEVTIGAEVAAETLNEVELVALPLPVVMPICPEVAPVGTTVAIEESEPTLKLAAIPLNFTELAPVNPDPATVTEVPTGPLAGEKELMLGFAVEVVTLNEDVLVPVPQLF